MRIEIDSLGEKEVPSEVYYGIQTARALENFPVTGIKHHKNFIKSYIMIKKAAAIANIKLKVLSEDIGNYIIKACDELLLGTYNDQFVVDVFQAGAGTSFNMNVNEVISNLALEKMNEKKGNYLIINPNDHVNLSQSSNDTFPTASHMAILFSFNTLIDGLNYLKKALEFKSKEFELIFKSARTHLEDAVPITLGQEFHAYSQAINRQMLNAVQRKKSIEEVAIGATAVGTGLNSPKGYKNLVIEELIKISGLNLRRAVDPMEALQSHAKMSAFSSFLKELALELIRIVNDLRLYNSGPRTGLAEIELPAVQPGSSIMPGKINPVMAECLNMVCFQVLGNDLAVSFAVQAGQLDLNVMTPVIIYNILQSMEMLINYLFVFSDNCIKGIKVNKNKCQYYLHSSSAIATILTPHIGYLKASEIVKESLETGKTIIELVEEKKLISPKKIKELFNFNKLI